MYPRFLVMIMCTIMCTSAIFSQDATGTISGKVTDGETGDPLVRATVMITVNGKTKGTYADSKGSYALRSVPVGEYDVRIRFLGFQEKLIKRVQVLAGKTSNADAVLKPERKTTADVVVEAKAARETEAAILTQRKNAAQVSDGVSEQEIKRQTDNDAGQVLKRVSGVTLVGDKFVYVRGINERYNNTTLNGASLASTENDKKAFAFDMFPAEFLQNASVVKSFTPDLPGNFAGGLVQLQTVDFPDGYAVRMSGGMGGTDNLTGQSNAFTTYTGGSRDYLGFDDGSRALPSTIPATRYDMNALIAKTRAYYAGDQTPENTAAAEEFRTLGTSFNNNVWKSEQRTAMPNGNFGLSFSNVYTPGGTEVGVIASANYGNSVALADLKKSGIASTREQIFEFAGTQWSRSVNLNALFNCAVKLGPTSMISLRNTYNHAADDDVIALNGSNFAQTRDLRLNSFDYSEKSLLSSQLLGEHTLEDAGNLFVDWKVGMSSSSRNQPDFRRLRYSRELNTQDQFVADIPYPGSQQGDGTMAGRFMSDLSDRVLNGALNLALPVGSAKIKVGAMTERRDRTFNTRSFTYIQSKIFTRGEVVADSILAQTPDQIFSAGNFGPDGLAMSEDSKSSDSYTADESLYAGYAMVDMPFEVFGMNLRAIAGARVEDNQTNLQSTYSFKTGTSIPDSMIRTNLHTTDLLPALNVVWKAYDDMNVRFSASQTLTRPSIREFAPFAFYDFQNLALIQGNPRLTRALIQNYDLRWEVFPKAGEVISAGVFYKRFKNAIEETIIPAASEIQRSFENAKDDAVNYGFEVELRKSLSVISDALSNFLFTSNIAIIRSEINVLQGLKNDIRPLWGQSPYSINFGLFYVEPESRTSVNLSYNRAGKRIVQVAQVGAFAFDDPHVYEMPRDQIDVNISRPIGDAFTLKLSVRDLLNPPTDWVQGGVMVASVQRGRAISISFGYTLN